MQKVEIKELLRLVEKNIDGEFDKGRTKIQENGKFAAVISAEEGDVVLSNDIFVPLTNILKYAFQIDDKPDLFQWMHEQANKYQQAVFELSILHNMDNDFQQPVSSDKDRRQKIRLLLCLSIEKSWE